MALPGRYEIQVWKGDSWSITVFVQQPDGTPVDLTGWLVVANIYRNAEATDLPLTAIGVAVSDGRIDLSLTPTQTALLDVFGVWDLKLTDTTGYVRTLLAGPYTPFGA